MIKFLAGLHYGKYGNYEPPHPLSFALQVMLIGIVGLLSYPTEGILLKIQGDSGPYFRQATPSAFTS